MLIVCASTFFKLSIYQNYRKCCQLLAVVEDMIELHLGWSDQPVSQVAGESILKISQIIYPLWIDHYHLEYSVNMILF